MRTFTNYSITGRIYDIRPWHFLLNQPIMKVKLTLGFCLLFFALSGQGQQMTVSGTVKDDAGANLPGVNVVVKGTTMGTTTDFDGKYSISVSSDATLVFTFIGFESKELVLNAAQKSLSVELEPASSLGQEQ